VHEVSVALSLVDGLSEEAARRGITRINTVHLRIGALTGIVEDALVFAWELATASTVAAGSRLQIERVPLAIYCRPCQAERTLSGVPNLHCPQCGEPSAEVVRGRELQLVSLEVPDD